MGSARIYWRWTVRRHDPRRDGCPCHWHAAGIQAGIYCEGSVSQAEQLVRKNAAKDNVLIGITDGIIKNIPTDWLSCAFQWYAVSAYNYVRLIAWLSTKDSAFTKDYLKRVIPRVTEYRHKVAAHFAITAPRDDNEADMIASIMTNIVYAHGYLRAGAMSEILTDENENEITGNPIDLWQSTEISNWI